jgi:uncharacterized protein YbaP (TraB family)
MNHTAKIQFLTCFFLALLAAPQLRAQPKTPKGKYPSLFWEITGNGLKKPSYLFGTMHVSSKKVFHLSDSFYFAIKRSDRVAIELNPETWQEEVMKENNSSRNRSLSFYYSSNNSSNFENKLLVADFSLKRYEPNLLGGFAAKPYIIDNLLYRTSNSSYNDFQEDTYLDLHIYQCGRKLGKQVSGLEDYQESERLTREAYRDAAKERRKKGRRYNPFMRRDEINEDDDDDYGYDRLDDAYRKGDLDRLDSIHRKYSTSEAFDEKFLYRRNEIQAKSMDTIMKKGESLFAAVGAAHLPGKRGVIEMLRQMGYNLRPVKMGDMDSRQKEAIERMHVPVPVSVQQSDDGFYKLEMPGKLYPASRNKGAKQTLQYSDMSNGAYYIVTRIKTKAAWWGHTPEQVMKKIDSMLYDNVAGKILSRQQIVRNGYPGVDVLNRTRKGDVQRQYIIATPHEVLFFKVSGTGEYVKEASAVQRFFNSLQLSDFVTATPAPFKPASGGFSVQLPHPPLQGFENGSQIFMAADAGSRIQYLLMKQDYYSEDHLSKDSFDLHLIKESFGSSRTIDSLSWSKPLQYQGYQALDCKYVLKKGGVVRTRFIVRGPHYYALAAMAPAETPKIDAYFNSFNIVPFIYGAEKPRKDTVLKFTVNSPVFPEEKEEEEDNYLSMLLDRDDDEDDDVRSVLAQLVGNSSKVIISDSTGERIQIQTSVLSPYVQVKDSAQLNKLNDEMLARGSSVLKEYRNRKDTLAGGLHVEETVFTAPGSGKWMLNKTFERNGRSHSLITVYDSLQGPSAFIRRFFESFRPADTSKPINLYAKKSPLFFSNYFSADSVARKKAIRVIDLVSFDESDLPQLKKAIEALNWKNKNYLGLKEDFISKLGAINSPASLQYLTDLYDRAGDTVNLQHGILAAMLEHKNQAAYNAFRDIIAKDPPVLDSEEDDYRVGENAFLRVLMRNIKSVAKDQDKETASVEFLSPLYDSLPLTKTILPDLMNLLNIEEYKPDMMDLFAHMADSGVLKPADYQSYFGRFFTEAKQELKKQNISDQKQLIEDKVKEMETADKDSRRDYQPYSGEENEDLARYARLLAPFYADNKDVRNFYDQLLQVKNEELKYSTLLFMLEKDWPVPDTLLAHYAKNPKKMSGFYDDLREIKKQQRFPAAYRKQELYWQSKLMESSGEYYGNRADTLVFLEKRAVDLDGKKGFVHFYKYRKTKESKNWYLATAGLVPADTSLMSVADTTKPTTSYAELFKDMDDIGSLFQGRFLRGIRQPGWVVNAESKIPDFTDLKDIKLTDAAALRKAINFELKKIIIEAQKSSSRFFANYDPYKEDDDEEYTSIVPAAPMPWEH